MCNRIAIINRGSLVALDTTEKLLQRIESKKIKFKIKNLVNLEKIKLEGVKFIKSDSGITAIYDKNKFKFDEIINLVKENAEIIDRKTIIKAVFVSDMFLIKSSSIILKVGFIVLFFH